MLLFSVVAIAVAVIRPQPRHPGVTLFAAIWLRLRPSPFTYVFPAPLKDKPDRRAAARERAGEK
jgi:hypothetical protein